MAWRILVAQVAPSLNRALAAHWTNRKALKTAWYWLMRASCAGIPLADGPRRVRITRFGHALLDADNLAGAHKSLVVDNLRQPKLEVLRKGGLRRRIGLGLIVDDDPRHVQVEYLQARIPKKQKPYTLIEIEDLEEVPCPMKP